MNAWCSLSEHLLLRKCISGACPLVLSLVYIVIHAAAEMSPSHLVLSGCASITFVS